MKLFSSTISTYARRVHIYLLENKIEIPIEYINLTKLENRSKSFLEKNPLGKVPVLQADDEYICESIYILLYLQSKFFSKVDILQEVKLITMLLRSDCYFANVISPIVFQTRMLSGDLLNQKNSSKQNESTRQEKEKKVTTRNSTNI